MTLVEAAPPSLLAPRPCALFGEDADLSPRDVAQERGVPLCDARAVLESTADAQRAESGTDRIFVRPDKKNGEVHMTDEGCLLLAQTLAKRIAELGLVK